MSQWHIFTGQPAEAGKEGAQKSLPPAPPWRRPGAEREAVLAATFCTPPGLVDAVNAALYLRRPLLITGKPGGGKSSLIHAVAKELALGDVLTWAINSRSTLREALYSYDALARLQHLQTLNPKAAAVVSEDAAPNPAETPAKTAEDDMGLFLTLGPLGTALASTTPRALLVDEIDKSDVDLPNDLLNVLDTGRFTIPELKRAHRSSASIPTADGRIVTVLSGEIVFKEYPFVVMTSNGERDFPAPFLRRCVQFQMPDPTPEDLKRIVLAHFAGKIGPDDADLEAKNKHGLLATFVSKRDEVALSTDQMLNAFHVLRASGADVDTAQRGEILETLFRKLS